MQRASISQYLWRGWVSPVCGADDVDTALDSVSRQLRRAAFLRDADALTDGQLLDCFLARSEDAAFEALVRRHGPMVLGVCRRVLGNAHDAEDAFQATFLVLARKAASIVPRELVGNWLYGVARRTALEARSAMARRLSRHGLPAVAGSLGAALAPDAAAAGVPAGLVAATVRAAALVSPGQAVAAGVVAADVAALTERVVRTMGLTKLEFAAAALL